MPTVLILAASPEDEDRLALSREVKSIKQALERSRNREKWRIETNEAATVEDLRRALLDYQPTIVNFSGHGKGDAGLCFDDDQGFTHPTHASPLAKLFHHFKEKLKCVVLNACFSTIQGEAIRQEIDYVIGMRSRIKDAAAIKFAVAFYDGVFAGTDFRTAFNLGCANIDLHNLPHTDVPVFLTSPQLGGTELAYTRDIPEIEDLLLAYLNAPYAERYRFTTKGDTLADAIRQHYGEAMLIRASKVTVISKQQIDKRHWKVLARIEGWGDRVFREYYLRIEDRCTRIDWEASVGFWSMPVKTYLALGSNEDIVARVTAEIDNQYYGHFADKERSFQSVRLETRTLERLFGYVPRSGSVYTELMNIIADGNPHQITLAIVNVDDDTEHVFIKAVLSRTWILSDEE